MRIIIAGSRNCQNYNELLKAIAASGFKPNVVISGTARGIDRMAERWAIRHNISVERYPANWEKFGKSAGYIRNAQMIKKAEALIALWDGKSKGTENIINLARKAGLVVYVWKIS